VAEYLRVAQANLEHFAPTAIFFPTELGGGVHIFGQGKALLVRDAANYIALDPVSAAPLYRQDASALDWLARWLHTVDPVHFGSWGGLGSRIVWGCAGLMLSLSIASGWGLFYLRYLRRPQKVARPFVGRSARWTNGLTLLLAMLVGGFTFLGGKKMQAEEALSVVASSETAALGEWPLHINQYARADGAGELQIVFEPRPYLSDLTVQWPGQTHVLKPVEVSWQGYRLPLLGSEMEDEIASVVLSGQDGQGQRLESRVVLRPVDDAESVSRIITAPGVQIFCLLLCVFLSGILISSVVFIGVGDYFAFKRGH